MGTVARRTVEECLTLDVGTLIRRLGDLNRPARGRLDWVDPDRRDRTASVEFELMVVAGGGPMLQLRYRLWDEATARLLIRLRASKPHLGGRRWWLTCPMTIDNQPCNRRCGKLYLPPGAAFFGCRTCHGLTYSSRRVSPRKAMMLE